MFGDGEVNAEGEAQPEEFDWSEDVSTFGDRLARAREYASMTQAQLARRLGVKVATIKNWEFDRSEPRANRLQMLSGLLNVSIIWLMTGEGEGGPAMHDTEATEEIAGLIGHIRETHYGRIFEIYSTPEPAVIANAPVPLRPHTDENFREPPPGIMIFHSIRASQDGGGASVMTDGFKLAEDLRTLDPEAFDLLARVPIPHRRFIDGVGLRAEAPVIQLDHFGEIREFRLNERTMGPIDLPGELIEPVYAALATMFQMTYDPKYHVHHLLMDGEALVFDNARVLHARTGFNGNRHVRLTHVGSDEVYSRWRQLKSRLEGAINPIS